jgi:hypothetical protein
MLTIQVTNVHCLSQLFSCTHIVWSHVRVLERIEPEGSHLMCRITAISTLQAAYVSLLHPNYQYCFCYWVVRFAGKWRSNMLAVGSNAICNLNGELVGISDFTGHFGSIWKHWFKDLTTKVKVGWLILWNIETILTLTKYI